MKRETAELERLINLQNFVDTEIVLLDEEILRISFWI
jgi:hypothetical protein